MYPDVYDQHANYRLEYYSFLSIFFFFLGTFSQFIKLVNNGYYNINVLSVSVLYVLDLKIRMMQLRMHFTL